MTRKNLHSGIRTRRLNKAARTILFTLGLFATSLAQPPAPVPATLEVNATSVPQQILLTWGGLPEHYYFIQVESDLTNPVWPYLPVVESGSGEPISYGFAGTDPVLFYRLEIANHWEQPPLSLDFSGTGFSNWNYIRQGLNPFDPESPLRRMLVLESWPTASPVDPADALTVPATVRLVSPMGFGMPGGTLSFSVQSGPFGLLDGEGNPVVGPVERTTDGQGRASVSLGLNGFDEGDGMLRVTVGQDPLAPWFDLPVGVSPGLPPFAPTDPAAQESPENEAALSWTDTVNDPMRTRYRVVRDGVEVGQAPDTSATDPLPGGWNEAVYTVVSEDWTSARSAPSNPAVLRNLDSGGLSVPGSPVLVEEGRRWAAVAWPPAASDHGIAGYHIKLNGQITATTPDSRWTFTNLPSSQHSVTVQAVDQRGVASSESAPLVFTHDPASGTTVAGGTEHTLLLDPDGRIFATGSKQVNAGGLHSPADATGAGADELWPLPATYFEDVERVEASEWGGLLLLESGEVLQLGVLTFDPSPFATVFAYAPDMGAAEVVGIGAGFHHYFSIEDITGHVWSWGTNDQRQLGRNTPAFEETIIPGKVELSGSAPLAGVEAVAGGETFSVALLGDGTLRTWGEKLYLGRPDATGTPDSWDHPGPVLDASSQPLGGFVSIAAGGSHTLALHANGEVWSFGRNDRAQLGYANTSAPVAVPQRVRTHTFGDPVLTNAVAVAAGLHHSLVLDANGVVWSFGDATQGQLGYDVVGGLQKRARPVTALNGVQVVAIAAGPYTGFAVDDQGRVHAWGLNAKGQLGDGTTTSRAAPQPMGTASTHLVFTPFKPHPTDPGGVFVSDARLNTDIRYTLDGSAVTASSTILSPGTALTPAPGAMVRARPYQGTLPAGVEHRWRAPTVAGGAGGDGFAVVVDSIGHVHAWGRRPDWRPGEDVGGGIFLGPLSNQPVRRVDASGHSALAVGYDGSVFGWGGNEAGILVPGGPAVLDVPTRGPNPPSTQFQDASLSAWTESGYGGPHRLTATGGHGVFASGVNDRGQLGMASGPSLEEDAGWVDLVPDPHGLESVTAATGVGFATDILGGTTAWGDWRLAGRGYREAIDPTTTSDWSATRTAFGNATQIVSGRLHLTALRSDGTVWTWGVLPPDGIQPQGVPQKVNLETAQSTVEPLSDVVAVDAGYRHNIALRADGTVWTWGENLHGELGYAALEDGVARQVPGLSGIHWVAAGKHFSMAGDASGDIWAWGRNTYGELGNPALPGGPTPVLVAIPAPPSPPGSPPTGGEDPPTSGGYVPPPLEGPDPTPGSAPEILIESPADLLPLNPI